MVLTRKKEIAAISTPLVFPGSDNSVWQSLSAFCYEGMHYLTVAGPDGRRVSTSRDLRRWQELRPLSEEDLSGLGSGEGEKISPVWSIGLDEERGLYVKY